MLVKVIKDDVIEGLHKSANIIPAKTGAAFLRTIWLKAQDDNLQVLSTDSNLEFCGTYDAEIRETGLVGVQGRSFYELVRKLSPGQITLRLDADSQTLVVEQDRDTYKLPVNDASWFQNLSDFPEQKAAPLSGDYLEELIDKISYCIADEDTMEAMACFSLQRSPGVEGEEDVYVEACGLNGHQFAMQRFAHEGLYELVGEEGILIQKKYLMELKKWLSDDAIEANISDKRLFFRTSDGAETFSLPLSYYNYPEYRNFFARLESEDVSSMTVDRGKILGYLDRLSIFNTENNRCTYFEFQDQDLLLSAQGQEVGSANVSIQVVFSGDLKKIAFPTRNLIEILTHYQSDEARFVFAGSEGPCMLTGEDDPDYSVIIMPMKIEEETYYSEEDI